MTTVKKLALTLALTPARGSRSRSSDFENRDLMSRQRNG